MAQPVLIDGVRTPYGSFLGSLSEASAVDLGATAVGGLLDRTRVDPDEIDWLVLGNAISAGVGQVPARQAGVYSGLSSDVSATTVNEASGSGLRAIAMAVDRIAAERKRFVVAGGMESMSNAPHLLRALRQGERLGEATITDALIYDSLWDVMYDSHMGELTEDLVERFDISREEQDRYALDSHQRAAEAIETGRFSDERVSVDAAGTEVDVDEGPRSDSSLDDLGSLPPSFREGGTITPGNASDLGDGAGCVLVARRKAAREAGIDPLARVVDYAVVYRDPKWFGMALGDAVERLLDSNGLAVEDVDVFELNEAFAAQMVYVRERLGIPRDDLNPHGGAVALGHPIGASGGMLTTTCLSLLEAEDAEFGVVGMSIGGGGGIAMLLKR